MALKLENNAPNSAFAPYRLSADKQYVVTDLETAESLDVLGKDIDGTKLAQLAGNKSSWIVEIRPKKATL
jgi:hypothetical protein